ncbi:hypothetical protein [Rhizobium sp. ZPR3]|uniref:Nucleotide modification associated domain-containing protein n=2 Tax=unclassified Rhizobium TaxID=2613769 RepID=A0AAU7SFA0_9HYPH
MTFFSYVVRWDHGFAPNPFHGTCSLATCKPGIRKKAVVGDWILGTGPSNRKLSDHAIFLMRVDEITTFNAYWQDARFARKRPVLNGSFKVRFGDNIYHRPTPESPWIQADSRHSQHGAVANMTNLKRDTDTTDNVLLSKTFIYWGDQAPKIPQKFAKFHIGRPLYSYDYTPKEVGAFLSWANSLGHDGCVGEPVEWKWSRYWR